MRISPQICAVENQMSLKINFCVNPIHLCYVLFGGTRSSLYTLGMYIPKKKIVYLYLGNEQNVSTSHSIS